MKGKATAKPIIILIDGQCNLCHGITRFVIQRDPHQHCKFASIQSEIGQSLMAEGGLDGGALNTFVMIEGGRYYTKSTGALRLARKLSGIWPLAYAFIVVPKFIRNLVYDYIASRRYRWFGHNESCLIPSAETRKRFLD
jgi:predicted DCC family thiol-disulfide oxidoreductase YuxK